MMKKLLSLVSLCVLCTVSYAQDVSLFKKSIFIQNGDTLPYRILLPPNFDINKEYPLVLFLHGRGESGADNELQLSHGANLFLSDSNRTKFPAIVVFPQNARSTYWSNVQTIIEENHKRTFYFVKTGEASMSMRLVISLLDNLFLRYHIQRDQVYVMGLSMGGMGTFEIVRRLPHTFAAAIPICGGANTETAPMLRNTSWWVFHGAKDDVVPPFHSQEMVKALRAAGARVKFTLYPGANHNSWDQAFAEPDLLRWLFSQKLKGMSP